MKGIFGSGSESVRHCAAGCPDVRTVTREAPPGRSCRFATIQLPHTPGDFSQRLPQQGNALCLSAQRSRTAPRAAARPSRRMAALYGRRRPRTRGSARAARSPSELEQRAGAVQPDDLATIIYTSGSTGLPKGVELTQFNIAFRINGTSRRFDADSENERCISTLARYVRDVRPTIMTVVPRILEKVSMGMRDKALSGGIKGKIAERAFARAMSKVPEVDVSPLDRLYELLVYGKLRAALGGRLRFTISGAAKLPEEIARFFINIGIPVYEGYGMTESSPVIACNYPGARKIGTVGPPFPDVGIRVDAEQEILVRGPNVMRGYHRNRKATAEVIDREGWLHTGDRGEMDSEGYLTILGRKKELFKKSTGEYVPPGPIDRMYADISGWK